MAVLNFCRAGQRSGSCVANAAAAHVSGYSRTARNAAAGHGESAPIFHKHTAAAAISSNAACNAAAGHGEGSPHIHTAAGTGCTAYDIAAGHGEGAAGYNSHAAAGISTGVATGDDAAVDSVRAAGLVQYPEFCALVNPELVRGVWGAVRQRQIAAAFDLNHSPGAGHFQHMVV